MSTGRHIRALRDDGLRFKSRPTHSRGMVQSPEPAGQPRRLACERCGASFDCGLGGGCWCAAELYRLPMPISQAEDCLCPACLRKASTAT
jgi:hypothetical protein